MKKFILKFFGLLVFLLSLFILVISSVKLYNYNREKTELEKFTKKTVEVTEKAECPISVDFDKLRKINEDICGWLYSEGTPINYPVARAANNNYYLHRTLEGEYAYAGTLFLDYRNSGDFTDVNSIIYGHNMKNDTMFGTLLEYRENEYFSKHSELYLLTPLRNYKIKLIAGAYVLNTSEIYNLSMEDAEEIICNLLDNSTFKSGYNYSKEDRFITLSTCINENSNTRYILIGTINDLGY